MPQQKVKIKYHQLAIDMNLDSLSPERSEALLEEINQFISQYPESPHLPVVKYWKNVLEEITIRSKRFEIHQNQIEEAEDNNAINELNGKKGKKGKSQNQK